MKVLSASSELYPLVKTGGLADVTGGLPAALSPHKVDMLSIVPGYPAVMAALEGGNQVHRYDDLFGGEARLLRGKAKGMRHIVTVRLSTHSSAAPLGRSSETNLSKSSAAWKFL